MGRFAAVTPEQHTDVTTGLLAYWTSRDEAAAAQAAKGVVDTGSRGTATAGGHLDRVAQLLGRVATVAGAPANRVFYKAPKDDPNHKTASNKTRYTLPGYYRPTKQWDVVIWDAPGKTPIACIELKSQNGPSYGNNANNRVEEALGNAVDIRAAKAAGLLDCLPWIGYAAVIEDDGWSDLERGDADNLWQDKDPHFESWSYLSRYTSLGARMVREGHYNSAWIVSTSRPSCPAIGKAEAAKYCEKIAWEVPEDEHTHEFRWRELDPGGSGYGQFVASLAAAVAMHYPDSAPASPEHVTLDLT